MNEDQSHLSPHRILFKIFRRVRRLIGKMVRKLFPLPSVSVESYRYLKDSAIEILYPKMRAALGKEDVFGRLPYIISQGLNKMSQTKDGRLLLSYFLMTEGDRQNAADSTRELSQGRLKVLFVAGMFPNEKHGGGLRFFDIMFELAKNHEVSLYSVFQPSLDGGFEKHVLPLVKNIRCIDDKTFSQNDYADWLNEVGEKYDVIYHLWPLAVPLMKVSKSNGAKVFFEYVECVSRSVWIDIQRQKTVENIDALSEKFLANFISEASAANLADGCIALTPEDQTFVKDLMNPKSIDIFPTGVSSFAVLDKLKLGSALLEKDFKTAIFVGYYDHTPNIEGLDWYFKNIHKKVLETVPNYKLKVVGRGNLMPLKEKYASWSGIEWVGEVEDIVPLVLSAHVCVSPLISGAGLRGKVIQYSIMGKPTISTDIGISGTPFRDKKSVLVGNAPQDFCSGLLSLLNDEKLAESISTEAKRVAVEHFAWAPVIEKMEIFFRAE